MDPYGSFVEKLMKLFVDSFWKVAHLCRTVERFYNLLSDDKESVGLFSYLGEPFRTFLEHVQNLSDTFCLF